MRRPLGLKLRDILVVRFEEDRVVLEPVPVEVYTEERIGTCLEDSRATLEEFEPAPRPPDALVHSTW
ncbi:hypothetical protein [Thermus antranikianii]|uniref:hypothetical protein n=1 Tax=Thermus antranikianii TaxID=88190 RepID=UPI001FE1845C|nr:hypothetical protein [Thermus antranikianii]